MVARKYRVWTKNAFGSYSIMNDWSTKSECKKMIIGRWGHWPGFAYISTAQTQESFVRYNGE